MAQIKCLFAFNSHVTRDFIGQWHDHPCTEIVYAGESAGLLLDGKQRISFGPRQVFTYQPGTLHNVHMSAEGTHICIGARGCGAEQLPVGAWPASESLASLFSQCMTLIGNPTPLQEPHLDLLAGLIVVEIRSRLESRPHQPDVDFAQRAREIIDTCFDEKLSLNELASNLYISPDYLRQLFRKRFGQSPIHYLIRKRIEAAQLLLSTSDLGIQEIGRRCGFDNPYYFSRMFRKLVNKSPSEYRCSSK